MTMRKNAKSKKIPRVDNHTPYSYEWLNGRFSKVYKYRDVSVREVYQTRYINK